MCNKQSNLSLRGQLIIFGLILAMLTGVPFLVSVIKRPHQELQKLIDKGRLSVSQVKMEIPPEDLSRLNALVDRVAGEQPQFGEDNLVRSFGMLVVEQRLLSETEMIGQLKESNNEDSEPEIDYEQVRLAYEFWQRQMDLDPGVLDIFRRVKKLLQETTGAAAEAGFEFDDIYLMYDTQQELYFLIDGSDWTESTYPGLTYDVIESDCPYFRDYLVNGPGFSANPLYYHYGMFPKFDEDEWGSWFSVWLSAEAPGNNAKYNNFALDLKADEVKDLLMSTGVKIVISALLFAVLIFVVAYIFSRQLSVPIRNLVAGAEAIIGAEYDHRVPDVGSADFRRLIEVFNQMVLGLKERLNMRETLAKLLSDELADQVAKDGLILGGQSANITSIFTDFAGFSTITQKMTSVEVVDLLNIYFEPLIDIIKKWGGLPDKFIGDAVVAIFGAPVLLEDHAERAVACAIELQWALRRINEQRRQQNLPVFEMRIGLNSGDVVVGAVGSNLKLEYTSIGETVNLANRMESKCQIGHILIGEETFSQIHGVFFDGIALDSKPTLVEVKGYNAPVKAFNVWVARLAISKNPESPTPQGYYSYEEVAHDIRSAADLTEEEKAAYHKIVTPRRVLS